MSKKGVCVFDIDRTLTCDGGCSLEQITHMKSCIDLCRSENMSIAINTARPPQTNILHTIPDEVQNMLQGVDVYTRPLSGISVEVQKLMHMYTIAKKHSLPTSKVVLLDDLASTCQLMNSAHVPSIHIRNENGITEEEYDKLFSIIHAM